MSTCGISEWKVEDPQEFDVAENHLGRLLQILDKGENLSAIKNSTNT